MKKILLAIDDDLLREVYKRGLEKSNFKVFPVQTKKEIFDIVEKEKIDFILIDVAIENVKGLEILKEIQEKKKIKLPTIVFSTIREENV
jgi:DNA-binding response OmpR family regulator